jgi:CRP-like cAMP-binding protein
MKTRHDHKVELLAGIPLLAHCERRELRGLASRFDLSWSSPGEVVDREGGRSRWWRIIVQGSATVSRDGVPTGLLGSGDWWGERALVTGGRSDLTVISLTPLVLLSLDRRSFLDLPRTHPRIAADMISVLACRPGPYEGAGLGLAAVAGPG